MEENMNVILNLIRTKNTLKELQKIMISWWFIWFFRNKICFNEETVNVQNASIIVKSCYEPWTSNSSEEKICEDIMYNKIPRSTQPIPCQVAWILPKEGWYKLNFDRSKSRFQHCSFGFIIRDHSGNPI